MRRNQVAVGFIGIAVALAACGKGGELPKLPGAASASPIGERAMAADSAGTSMMVANIRYELADGLSTKVKTGKAYQFNDATEADVMRLAKAFGVEGDVRKDGESWSVGGSEKGEEVRADGAYLYVSRNGGVFSMSVNSPATGSGSSGCSVEPVAPDTPVASDEGVAKCEAPVTTTTIPKDAPTADGAKKAAAEALKAAGVNVEGAKVTVESYDGSVQNVRYQHIVDDAPVVGFETYVAVGVKDKIVSASGYLVDPSSVGTYELASLQRAVERLNESFGDMRTLEGRDDAAATAVAPARGEPQVEPAPAPGEPLVDPAVSEQPDQSTEPTVVTLTKVDVELMLQSDFDGDLWLVPAYKFASDDGNEVTAQAAADQYIEEPPADDMPAPSDGGGGGEPGSTEPGGGSPGTDPQCAPISGDLSGEVCASATSVKAGQPVSFRITAADGDRGFSTGPCFDGVTVAYGDDAGGDIRCEACSTEVPAGPGKMSVERSHTYEKPGTYTAKFTIKSGADCAADPKDSQAEVSLKITVA